MAQHLNYMYSRNLTLTIRILILFNPYVACNLYIKTPNFHESPNFHKTTCHILIAVTIV